MINLNKVRRSLNDTLNNYKATLQNNNKLKKKNKLLVKKNKKLHERIKNHINYSKDDEHKLLHKKSNNKSSHNYQKIKSTTNKLEKLKQHHTMYSTRETNRILVFLEREWLKLYNFQLNYHPENNNLNRHKNFIQKITIYRQNNINEDKIDDLSNHIVKEITQNLESYQLTSSYPKVKITHKAINTASSKSNLISITTHSKYLDCFILLNQINYMILIIASHKHNRFGMFMNNWNYIIDNECIDTPTSWIIKQTNKTKKLGHLPLINSYHMNYRKINQMLIRQALHILYSSKINNDEKHILKHVINFDWHKVIVKSIKVNAPKILKGHCNNIDVIIYLKHYCIVSGKNIQHQLINLMASSHNFNLINYYTKIGSNINDANGLYYFNKHNIKKTHKMNMDMLCNLLD